MGGLQYTTMRHCFGPNETIRAIIRKLNHQGMSQNMLNLLTAEYNKINGDKVPRPGDCVDIPIFVGFIGMADIKPEKKE